MCVECCILIHVFIFFSYKVKTSKERRKWILSALRKHCGGVLLLWRAYSLQDHGEGPCSDPGTIQGAAYEERKLQVKSAYLGKLSIPAFPHLYTSEEPLKCFFKSLGTLADDEYIV